MTTIDAVVGLNTGVVDFVRHYGDSTLRSLISGNKKANPPSLYERGIECAKQGDYGAAIGFFAEADLTRERTDDGEFYETVANTIFTINLLGPGYGLGKLKDTMNKRIKPGLVKRLSVSDEDGLVVDFGDIKFGYKKEQMPTKCRNDVSMFTQSKSFSGITADVTKKLALKFYGNREDARTEAFWLKFFGDSGKIYVPKLISAGNLDETYFNQMEMEEGAVNFAEMIRRQSNEADRSGLVKQAIELGLDIYQAIIDRYSAVEASIRKEGISIELSRQYYEERFDEFEAQLRKKGDHGLAVRLAGCRDDVIERVSENKTGLIHNDFAPRNLIFVPSKDSGHKLVPLDHENYVRGNPLTQVISFVKNPENMLTEAASNRLIEDAKSRIGDSSLMPVTSGLIRAMNIFWDVRQARRCPEDKEMFEWYVNDMKGALER